VEATLYLANLDAFYFVSFYQELALLQKTIFAAAVYSGPIIMRLLMLTFTLFRYKFTKIPIILPDQYTFIRGTPVLRVVNGRVVALLKTDNGAYIAIDPYSQAGLALAQFATMTKGKDEMAVVGSVPITLKSWPKGQVLLRSGDQVVGQAFRLGSFLVTAKHVLDGCPEFDIVSERGVINIKNPAYNSFHDVASIRLTQVEWAYLGVQQLKQAESDFPAATVSANVGLGWAKSAGRVPEVSGFQVFHYLTTEPGYSGAPLVDNQNRVIGVHLGSADTGDMEGCNRFATRYCVRQVVRESDETWWKKKKWESEEEYVDDSEFSGDLGGPEDDYDVAYGQDDRGDGYLAVYNKTQGKYKKLTGMSKSQAKDQAASLQRKLYGKTAKARALNTGESLLPSNPAQAIFAECVREIAKAENWPKDRTEVYLEQASLFHLEHAFRTARAMYSTDEKILESLKSQRIGVIFKLFMKKCQERATEKLVAQALVQLSGGDEAVPLQNGLKESSRTQGRLQETETQASLSLSTRTPSEPPTSSSPSSTTMKKTQTTSSDTTEGVNSKKKRKRSHKRKSSSPSSVPTVGPKEGPPPLLLPTVPTAVTSSR
jgi:hypothetical protein